MASNVPGEIKESAGANAEQQVASEFNTYTTDYLTGSQVSLFIGPVWVEDFAAITYQMMNSKVPVHGWNELYADMIQDGKFTIQGTLFVNFKETDYLFRLIEQIRQEIDNASGIETIDNIIEQRKNKFRTRIETRLLERTNFDISQVAKIVEQASNRFDVVVNELVNQQRSTFKYDLSVVAGNNRNDNSAIKIFEGFNIVQESLESQPDDNSLLTRYNWFALKARSRRRNRRVDVQIQKYEIDVKRMLDETISYLVDGFQLRNRQTILNILKNKEREDIKDLTLFDIATSIDYSTITNPDGSINETRKNRGLLDIPYIGFENISLSEFHEDELVASLKSADKIGVGGLVPPGSNNFGKNALLNKVRVIFEAPLDFRISQQIYKFRIDPITGNLDTERQSEEVVGKQYEIVLNNHDGRILHPDHEILAAEGFDLVGEIMPSPASIRESGIIIRKTAKLSVADVSSEEQGFFDDMAQQLGLEYLNDIKDNNAYSSEIRSYYTNSFLSIQSPVIRLVNRTKPYSRKNSNSKEITIKTPKFNTTIFDITNFIYIPEDPLNSSSIPDGVQVIKAIPYPYMDTIITKSELLGDSSGNPSSDPVSPEKISTEPSTATDPIDIAQEEVDNKNSPIKQSLPGSGFVKSGKSGFSKALSKIKDGLVAGDGKGAIVAPIEWRYYTPGVGTDSLDEVILGNYDFNYDNVSPTELRSILSNIYPDVQNLLGNINKSFHLIPITINANVYAKIKGLTDTQKDTLFNNYSSNTNPLDIKVLVYSILYNLAQGNSEYSKVLSASLDPEYDYILKNVNGLRAAGANLDIEFSYIHRLKPIKYETPLTDPLFVVYMVVITDELSFNQVNELIEIIDEEKNIKYNFIGKYGIIPDNDSIIASRVLSKDLQDSFISEPHKLINVSNNYPVAQRVEMDTLIRNDFRTYKVRDSFLETLYNNIGIGSFLDAIKSGIATIASWFTIDYDPQYDPELGKNIVQYMEDMNEYGSIILESEPSALDDWWGYVTNAVANFPILIRWTADSIAAGLNAVFSLFTKSRVGNMLMSPLVWHATWMNEELTEEVILNNIVGFSGNMYTVVDLRAAAEELAAHYYYDSYVSKVGKRRSEEIKRYGSQNKVPRLQAPLEDSGYRSMLDQITKSSENTFGSKEQMIEYIIGNLRKRLTEYNRDDSHKVSITTERAYKLPDDPFRPRIGKRSREKGKEDVLYIKYKNIFPTNVAIRKYATNKPDAQKEIGTFTNDFFNNPNTNF